MPVVYDWAGVYFGGHVGYRWANANFSSPAYFIDPISFPARNENYGLNGGIFGVQAGYNYLLAPSILTGLEADWSWGSSSASVSHSFSGPELDGFTFREVGEVKLGWQSTIRGRLGYVSGPLLLYGTGGLALINVIWNDSVNFSSFFGTQNPAWSSNVTLTGGVVGAGVEYMYAANWIGRVEYLYETFGNITVHQGLGPQAGTLDLRDVQKLRVAISYKFGH
jgi:opacity protein-like surface antigen